MSQTPTFSTGKAGETVLFVAFPWENKGKQYFCDLPGRFLIGNRRGVNHKSTVSLCFPLETQQKVLFPFIFLCESVILKVYVSETYIFLVQIVEIIVVLIVFLEHGNFASGRHLRWEHVQVNNCHRSLLILAIS